MTGGLARFCFPLRVQFPFFSLFGRLFIRAVSFLEVTRGRSDFLSQVLLRIRIIRIMENQPGIAIFLCYFGNRLDSHFATIIQGALKYLSTICFYPQLRKYNVFFYSII